MDKKHRIYRANSAHRARPDLHALRPDAMPALLLPLLPAVPRTEGAMPALRNRPVRTALTAMVD